MKNELQPTRNTFFQEIFNVKINKQQKANDKKEKCSNVFANKQTTDFQQAIKTKMLKCLCQQQKQLI